MKTRIEIESRIAYLQIELVTTEDGMDIQLLQRSINELEWVLGLQEALNG
jgi:hypothetical protein